MTRLPVVSIHGLKIPEYCRERGSPREKGREGGESALYIILFCVWLFRHNLSSLRPTFLSLSRKVAHKRHPPPPPRFRLSIVHRGPVIYSFCERRKRRARFIRGNNGHAVQREFTARGIPFIRASRDFPREKLGFSALSARSVAGRARK